jgi:ribosomal protein S9
VLVASQLEVEPKNYPFLLFATGKKRKEFLRALVQESGSVYLNLAFKLYPREVTEEMMMSRKKQKEWTQADAIIYMVEQVGLEPEEAVRVMAAKALQSRSPDARGRLIDALIEQLGPEEFEAHLRARQEAA